MSVHPHARGEHLVRGWKGLSWIGSSPRPWGTLLGGGAQLGGHRFIPTPVGNTRASSRQLSAQSVHPHARGEHDVVLSASVYYTGSSPRPWGTRAPGGQPGRVHRFIPTPVGNTPTPSRRPAARPVHPHARGEHPWPFAVAVGDAGSSPRPWGTPHGRGAEVVRPRFIPTPVGNTPVRRCVRSALPVHPHARGEHVFTAPAETVRTGSSPRPWGTPRGEPGPRGGRRFIPTPVGNTQVFWKHQIGSAVHPHARGEHLGTGAQMQNHSGSSPRPWGTPQVLAGAALQFRFIPTPVGNTR